MPGRRGGVRVLLVAVHDDRALSDGAHTFEVRATDAVGNTDTSPATRSFTVDTTAAGHHDQAGPSGPTNDSTPTFSFTADGPARRSSAGSTRRRRVLPCAVHARGR